MSQENAKRTLTTIFYADVADYSRLTGMNEEGTHRRVMATLDAVSEKIKSSGGTVLRYAGDAILAIFPSVIVAIDTSTEIQGELALGNAVLPEDERLQIRIGINLGDVIDDRGEVYGDGVNLAARLETAAEPGGICISSVVWDQCRGKVDATFTDGGEQQFKNIDRPHRTFHWTPNKAQSVKEIPLHEKPSIAVLPFDNMSGDPEQEYFTDGITEDIITELSRFRSLFVIARNSSFAYKGKSVNVVEIGRELGVAYLVEGSVRKAGNRVRITAQLIETESGKHVWAERYDRDLDDIFAVQDEVANAIVTAVEPAFGSLERERARRKPPGNLDAWESYQRGLWNVYRFAAQENIDAQSFFRRAIELDPNFAPAHAGLAYAIYLSVLMGFGADLALAPGEARAAAQRALTLDGDDAVAHAVVGRVHIMVGEHDAAISACETAVSLNPNLATAHYGLGTALIYSGRYEEGIAEADEAIRLSPRDPMLWAFLNIKAMAKFGMEHYEETLELALAAQRQPNAGTLAYLHEVVALVHLGRIKEARLAFEHARTIKPDFDPNFVVSAIKQARAASRELYLDALKKVELEN